MNLFNIAIKNIKRNLNNYFLYFVSMVFSIMIYFTFSSIQYNKLILDLTRTYLKVNTAFQVCSIIIALFTAFFIWYSNSFFTGKRKKEVALYCLMGVKKVKIARMLFYENLLMGVMALVSGILAGSVFSRLFVMILMKLMGMEIALTFYIPVEAVISTVFVYLVLFLVTALQSYFLIYRFQLVELFKAENTGQKQPKAAIVPALLSVLLIGTGYYMALNFNGIGIANFLVRAMAILAVTVPGTYMFFSSLVFLAVKLKRNNKKTYYKGMNMIGTSHLLYRIKSNSKLLATIAVLSATSLSAMSGAAAFYLDQKEGVRKMQPFSFIYLMKDDVLDKKVEQVISGYPKNRIKNSIEIKYINVEGSYPNMLKLVGKPTDYEKAKDNVISLSTMKAILKARGLEDDIILSDGEVVMYFYTMYSDKYMENPKGKTMYYSIDGKEKPFKIKDCKSDPIINRVLTGSPSIVNMVVVGDDIYDKLSANSIENSFKAINIENPEISMEVTREVTKTLLKSRLYTKGQLPFSAFFDVYTEMMYKMGVLVFLAFFAGMVFLICTGSMIFFKQLSEAGHDRSRYGILKKIGVSSAAMKISIAKQMLLVFLSPLLVGVAHSLVAIQILQPSIKISVIYPALGTTAIYTMIFSIYYVITVSYYNKIVNSKDLGY